VVAPNKDQSLNNKVAVSQIMKDNLAALKIPEPILNLFEYTPITADMTLK